MPGTLSVDSIESNTTNSNLERGRQLYQKGYVSNVKIIGNDLIVANVKGHKVYKVFLEYRNGNYNSYCNCLYEPKGQCKHQVAVKYSLLDFMKGENSGGVKEKKLFLLNLFYIIQKQFFTTVYRLKKGISKK